MTKRQLIELYVLTIVIFLGVLIALETGVRNFKSKTETVPESIEALIAALPNMQISGREVGNQMLIHNVAFFAHHPDPISVDVGYVGTSRSKILRPEYFGVSRAVVGAGNTYSEISYGLLLQAEILRLRFPNLKRVYFETSMLLRRPARLIVEEDHRKYLPLLKGMSPLCAELSGASRCKMVFDELDSHQRREERPWRLELLKKRGELRFANLIAEQEKNIRVEDDPLMSALRPSGERNYLPKPIASPKDLVAEISNDNSKVQRLRSIISDAPWDGLVDLIAMWGRKHNIEVVFFQPPVRSDLYRFQVQYGLAEHVADIERLARQYQLPFIDLNRPELGYLNDWTLFSDEDHMETCIGSGLLTLALESGYRTYRSDRNIFPRISRTDLQASSAKKLDVCS